ncbi:peroxiredoxin family protein [Chitinophaga niabensis]|nr:redoxin domain-containing protein [Chitinophaga niabensis]
MKMRRWMFLLLCLPTLLKAQTNTNTTTNISPFKQYSIISPLPLTLYDGSTFSKNDLPKNKPVLVFVFSVECDHCAHMTEEILKNIGKFGKTQLLMITPFKLERMKAWYDEYKIKNYPNIIMAAEPTRQILSYYDLHNFPGTYIYNKKHRLEADYEGTVKLDTLLKHL